jgi:hypothetical protein
LCHGTNERSLKSIMILDFDQEKLQVIDVKTLVYLPYPYNRCFNHFSIIYKFYLF